MRYTPLLLFFSFSYAIFYTGILIFNEFNVEATRNIFIPFFIISLFLVLIFLFLNNDYYEKIIKIYDKYNRGKKKLTYAEERYDNNMERLIKDKKDIQQYFDGKEMSLTGLTDVLIGGGMIFGTTLLSKIIEINKVDYDNEEKLKIDILKKFFENVNTLTKGAGAGAPDDNVSDELKKMFNDLRPFVEVGGVKKNRRQLIQESKGRGDQGLATEALKKIKKLIEENMNDHNVKSDLVELYNAITNSCREKYYKLMDDIVTLDSVQHLVRYYYNKERLEAIKEILDDESIELEKVLREEIRKANNVMYDKGIKYLYDGKDKEKKTENLGYSLKNAALDLEKEGEIIKTVLNEIVAGITEIETYINTITDATQKTMLEDNFKIIKDVFKVNQEKYNNEFTKEIGEAKIEKDRVKIEENLEKCRELLRNSKDNRDKFNSKMVEFYNIKEKREFNILRDEYNKGDALVLT